MMKKIYSLARNPHGFYEVSPKPTLDDLKKHYGEDYYQNNHGSYQTTYSDVELKFFWVEAELALRTVNRSALATEKKLLDLGCGEGFFAGHFKKWGWEVE